MEVLQLLLVVWCQLVVEYQLVAQLEELEYPSVAEFQLAPVC